jgi:hypothetical protein
VGNKPGDQQRATTSNTLSGLPAHLILIDFLLFFYVDKNEKKLGHKLPLTHSSPPVLRNSRPDHRRLPEAIKDARKIIAEQYIKKEYKEAPPTS